MRGWQITISLGFYGKQQYCEDQGYSLLMTLIQILPVTDVWLPLTFPMKEDTPLDRVLRSMDFIVIANQ